MELIKEMIMLEMRENKFPVRVKGKGWTESIRYGFKNKEDDEGMSESEPVTEMLVVNQTKGRWNVQGGAVNDSSIEKVSNKDVSQRLSDDALIDIVQIPENKENDTEGEKEKDNGMDLTNKGSNNLSLNSNMDLNNRLDW